MTPPPWKIGELAKRTGLTVRTLHHYDAIGLLTPSHHTGSGHRLYSEVDVKRLQQVVSLRELGFSLEEVRRCLSDPEFSPGRVVALHAARLAEQIEDLGRLKTRLEWLSATLERAETVSVEEFLNVIEGTAMIEKYYTPEQLETLKKRGEEIGPERIREVEAEWPRLMAEVQAEMDKGTDPTSPVVVALAHRWKGLVREFTGGDPGITQSLKNLWRNESNIHGMETSPVRKMGDYINQALASEPGGETL